ncbi:hypothetical protein DFJ43DRAFT_849246 [Lentinula guzmanii]|uniref:F-box domain-containing protein n=1 Tax=Lentinula guzmanii TaxID=2804957 RepID=A0AA38JA86_9AGAR|nr:hypothetical protein DFJ43DRAFT_849246 [Lentinula guzmanii]KAJ3794707.1 hypothetical protein GGU11DRAFT_282670 [Lentinula aff. detonsa]
MAAARLPLELQDMIIESILDLDRSYLSLASLVCRDWRNRSYERGFSSIYFSSHSIPVFASFLENPFSRPAIFTRVRRLRILGGGETFIWSTSLLGDLVKLVHHLAQIGRISVLTLDNLNWAVLDPALAAMLTDFRATERLYMHRIYFAHLGQFSDFVARFRFLRAFDLQSVEFAARSGWNIHLPLLTPYEFGHCVSLDANNMTLSKRLTWFYPKCISLEQQRLSTVHGAQIFCDSSTGSDLLRNLGPLLTRLDIISESIAADENIASLDISTNFSIRHLHLASPARVLSMISWLPSLLARVKSLNLRTLHVSFAQSRQFHLDRSFLKHIAGILAEPQYQELEVIEFIASSARCGRLEDSVKTDIIRCIRSCLPSWDKRGILAFTFH